MLGRASVFDERCTRKNCRCRAHVKEKRCHKILAEVMYTRHSGTSEQFELTFPFFMQRVVHSNRSGASELAMERLNVPLVSDEDILDVLLDISELPVYSES